MTDYNQNSVIKTEKGETKPCAYIATELCEKGDLFDYVALGGFEDSIVKTIFMNILSAIDQIH